MYYLNNVMSGMDNMKRIHEDSNKQIHDTGQSSYINLYNVVFNICMLNYMILP